MIKPSTPAGEINQERLRGNTSQRSALVTNNRLTDAGKRLAFLNGLPKRPSQSVKHVVSPRYYFTGQLHQRVKTEYFNQYQLIF